MFQLAQINVGRLVAPLDDPRLASFVDQLGPVNALAESSPGFVWRLKSESGNATDLDYNGDPLMIVNMSVWSSREALQEFVYRSHHLQVFRDRRQWFEKMELANYCLWWVKAGHIPSISEGRDRLEHYQKHGATPYSFWFQQRFPAPESMVAAG